MNNDANATQGLGNSALGLSSVKSKSRAHLMSARPTTPYSEGTSFRAPIDGTVLEATRVFMKVKTRNTRLGKLIVAVDKFNWNRRDGLVYRLNDELPSIPADRCQCNAGDWISWHTAGGKHFKINFSEILRRVCGEDEVKPAGGVQPDQPKA